MVSLPLLVTSIKYERVPSLLSIVSKKSMERSSSELDTVSVIVNWILLLDSRLSSMLLVVSMLQYFLFFTGYLQTIIPGQVTSKQLLGQFLFYLVLFKHLFSTDGLHSNLIQIYAPVSTG